MNITYILITFLSLSNVLIPVAWAKPKGCSPSDPTGSNRNSNLCFKYPPFGLKPFGGSFTKSFVHKGYYGPRITPIKPGIDLKPKIGFSRAIIFLEKDLNISNILEQYSSAATSSQKYL